MIRIVNINLFVLVILIAHGVGAAELYSPAIEPSKLNLLLTGGKPPLVVDVRSPDEYSAGHIPNSVNIPVPMIARHLDEMRKASDLVLYCNDTRFTRMAERILLNNRVENFVHLGGGLNAWEYAQLPIVSSFE